MSPENPLKRMQQWLELAKDLPEDEATKMTLATLGPDGTVRARIVLLKHVDERGLIFHTNLHSRKARDIEAHAQVALCMHWSSLDLQIRVEGRCELVDSAASDAYFASRPRISQIGAWASKQSEVCTHEELHERIAHFEKTFAGKPVPRPEFWGGIRVVPQRVEFWQAAEGRLHDRLAYQIERWPDAYQTAILFP